MRKLLFIVILGLGSSLNCMEREKTLPVEMEMAILAIPGNENLREKIKILPKYRRVCKEWNSRFHNSSNLNFFFQPLELKGLSETQIKAIKAFLCFALSNENAKQAEISFLKDLHNHFGIEEIPLAKLLTDGFPLHRMAKGGASKATNCLILLGCDKETQNEDKLCPLHEAAANGHLEVVRVLLAQNANKEAEGLIGLRPLHFASMKGYCAIVQFLLTQGAEREAQEEFHNFTALHYAAAAGHLEIVLSLLTEGCNKEACGKGAVTPLHRAAENGHLNVVQLLLAQGAEKNALCDRDRTPLHYAAEGGHLDVVRFLLSQGVAKQTRKNDTPTPLHDSARMGHLEIMKLLLNLWVYLARHRIGISE